jgi:quercetin dioxygenase-like cupin family protein
MSGSKELEPIALTREEGEALWFLGGLAIVKAAGETTGGRCAIIEFHAPRGNGAPLHMHTREDEWFYVLEGELTFWIGGRVIKAAAGAFVYGPRGVPHTFVVSSEESRFLLGVEPAGFENFMRALGEPAKALSLPPPADRPPDIAHLTKVAADYGIQVLGPPGIPK